MIIRKLSSDGRPAGRGRQAARDEAGRFRWEISCQRDGRRWHRIYWAHEDSDAVRQFDAERGAATHGITWTQGLQMWLDATKPSADHAGHFRRNVGILVGLIGDKAIEETTLQEFLLLVDERLKVSSRTAHYARAIRRIATWLRARGLVRVIQFEHLPGFTDKPSRPRQAIESPRAHLDALPRYARPIVEFLLLTGMRSSEACGLTSDQLEGNVVTFRQKGSSVRRVLLTDRALSLIQRKQGHLFRTKRGRQWTRDVLRRCCQRYWDRAGLRHATVHELRHTFATLAAQGGATAQQLQAAMGWTTSRMADRYVHMAEGATLEVAKIVQNLCSDPPL